MFIVKCLNKNYYAICYSDNSLVSDLVLMDLVNLLNKFDNEKQAKKVVNFLNKI